MDEHSNVAHLCFKATRFFRTSYRDFVVLIHWRELADGTCLVVGRSVKHALCPPDRTKKFVRGTIMFSGWVLRPLSPAAPGGPARSAVTYMVHCDLGGAAPAWMKNLVATQQPLIMRDLAEFFRPQNVTL